jgi:hypothetical protein
VSDETVLDDTMVVQEEQVIGSNNDLKDVKTRKVVHVVMSAVIILVVILLKYVTTDSAIGLLMKFAGFTYGPLIGLFFFGIMTKRIVNDISIPFLAIASILITFILWFYSAGAPGVDGASEGIFGAYRFGFEIIILNALITFILLFGFSKKH